MPQIVVVPELFRSQHLLDNERKYNIMIITHPTGLYAQAGQLPINPEDSGNITFTISSEEPARSIALVLQLPVAEELRPRPPLIFSDAERRLAVGELVYTIVSANRAQTGTNAKLFDIGEFLEFDDTEDIELPTVNVQSLVDIQHNTNLLDLPGAGLSDEDIDDVVELSTQRKKELEGIVAALQVQINNTKMLILENQKQLNETRKIIDAIEELGSGGSEILNSLIVREATLTNERTDLIASVNQLNVELTESINSLLKVSTLVR